MEGWLATGKRMEWVYRQKGKIIITSWSVPSVWPNSTSWSSDVRSHGKSRTGSLNEEISGWTNLSWICLRLLKVRPGLQCLPDSHPLLTATVHHLSTWQKNIVSQYLQNWLMCSSRCTTSRRQSGCIYPWRQPDLSLPRHKSSSPLCWPVQGWTSLCCAVKNRLHQGFAHFFKLDGKLKNQQRGE